MCQEIATEMMQVLSGCTLYDKASTEFAKHAARGDCDEMWNYYNALLSYRPNVGAGIRSSGGKPIEAVSSEMQRLYRLHR